MITFNTGRLYTAEGQRIAATEVEGKIYFCDVDRMISGVITVPCKLVEAQIMECYDRNEYQGVCNPILRDLAEAAAKPVPARYDEAAVDKAIKGSRQKIGGREAKLIKALLQGRAA